VASDYSRVDVDSHIQEKPDTWTSRLSRARFGDRIPHIAEVDGREVWVIDGAATNVLCLCPAVMPDRVAYPARWSEIPPGVYRAEERLAYMDHDGIGCQVMYANISGVSGGRFQGKDPDFEEACVRAYNDLQTEEWLGAAPGRFVALTIPPHSSMGRTLAEVVRCHAAGHRGVILFGTPHLRGLPNYSDPYWDPLWATCQERGIVVNMHGSGEAPPAMRIQPPAGTEHRRAGAALAASGFSIQPQYFANFLFAGVLDRYPELAFVAAESGIGWLPWLLEACDHAWETGALWDKGLPNRPSEVFRRQCYVDFWYEVSAIQAYRHVIGVDRILWETDFPHATSLWPDTEAFLARALAGVPEGERRLILAENAQRVYKLPPDGPPSGDAAAG
jgi:predicted TIM-barrel fold metal-dependent hydrolase